MADKQQNQTSRPSLKDKPNFNKIIEDYISNVKKDKSQFNQLLGTYNKVYSEEIESKTISSENTPMQNPYIKTQWKSIYNVILKRPIDSSEKVTPFDVSGEQKKLGHNNLMTYYQSGIPHTTRDTKKLFEFSNTNSSPIEYNQRPLEDIYIDYAYNRKKRMILQEQFIQQNGKNNQVIRTIMSGKPVSKKRSNIIERNIMTVRNGSERVRIINQTLSERQFSKNQIKNKLGSSNSKIVLLQKAEQIVNEDKNGKEIEFIQKKVIPYHKINNGGQFKKSWSVRQLTNSNIIHNPDANFFQGIKEKNKNQNSKQRHHIMIGNLPLFKSENQYTVSSSITKRSKQKHQIENTQSPGPEFSHFNWDFNNERKKHLEQMKQSFSENYLNNVLKNVKEEFFKGSGKKSLSPKREENNQ